MKKRGREKVWEKDKEERSGLVGKREEGRKGEK